MFGSAASVEAIVDSCAVKQAQSTAKLFLLAPN